MGDHDAMRARASELHRMLEQLEQQIEVKQEKLKECEQGVMSHARFREGEHFGKPSRDFDLSGILGRLISLFKVKDPRYYRAIEAIAAGGLYAVVVKDSTVAKALLSNQRSMPR